VIVEDHGSDWGPGSSDESNESDSHEELELRSFGSTREQLGTTALQGALYVFHNALRMEAKHVHHLQRCYLSHTTTTYEITPISIGWTRGFCGPIERNRPYEKKASSPCSLISYLWICNTSEERAENRSAPE